MMIKYWRYRNQLFHKFDKGIRFDKEGFESSKSEAVANFIARHLPGEVVYDAFTGIGSSAIAFAREGKRVVSVEINSERSKMAAHNAAIYDVDGLIEFVVGDSMELWKQFDFDAAYFDPPWGGVGYEKWKSLDYSSLKLNILPLIKMLIARGKNVAVTVPLNFDLNELKKINRHVHIYYNNQYGKPYCMHCIWRNDEKWPGP